MRVLEVMIAVLVYGEALTAAHFVTFGCIWVALAIFTADQLRRSNPRVRPDFRLL